MILDRFTWVTSRKFTILFLFVTLCALFPLNVDFLQEISLDKHKFKLAERETNANRKQPRDQDLL